VSGIDIRAHIARILEREFDPLGPRTQFAVIAGVVVSELGWDDLMALLDENYPASVFPTTEDREDRDTGPRIISLMRTIGQLRATAGELE
jgi:hypothetical protein